MRIHELFSGDIENRGVLSGITNGSKSAYFEPVPFNWDEHLQGKKVQGLSPIRKDRAKWLCVDIDLKIDPMEFCGKIFMKLGPQYFPFKTMSGRWRVVEFLDDWENLESVAKRSKDLENIIFKKCKYKCDSGHTLPYNKGWVFLPYHSADTTCYSPGGNPLTKEQFEFRCRYKNIALIASAVGMKPGGRAKALFNIALYKKHFPACDVTLEEINKNFFEPMDDLYFHKQQNHVLKSINKTEYNKQYLYNGIPKWCEDMCGVRPYMEDSFAEEVVAPELVKDFIYCNQNKDFYEIAKDIFRDKEQMNEWWLHVTKGKPITKILLENPSLIKVWSVLVHHGYKPGVIDVSPNEIKGIKPGKYLNHYKPSSVLATPGDHHKFIEYYQWLFQSEDKIIYNNKEYTQFDIVMMFLANLVQNPGRKAMWGILIQSTQGSGKGLLAEIIESILGQNNCLTNVTFDGLVRDHSTLLKGKQFIVINELMLTGRRVEGKELANKLKPFFTDPVHIINPKFKEEILCPNLVNLFLYSNDPKPLHVDQDDRRLCAIKVYHTKEEIIKKIEEYVPYLLALVKDPSSIKHYLQKIVELPDERFFGKDAPKTISKQELIENSKDDFEAIMDEAFRDHSFPFANKKYVVSKEKDIGYTYRGYVVISELEEVIKFDPQFKKVFCDRFTITSWVKKNAIPWPDGKMNKEIILPFGREKKRAWLLEDIKEVKGKFYSQKTGAELGKDYAEYRFRATDDQVSSPDWSFVNRAENIKQTEETLFGGLYEKKE